MKITHKIDIHLDKYRPEAEIVVMQCDANTRELQFMLYSNDAAWPIPEAAKIYVGFSKPDGTGGFYDTLPDGVGACTVESNTVTAVLAEQVLTVPGKVFVSVSLQEEGQILTTFAVQLNVKPKPGIAVMQSENYFCLKALIEAATVAAQKPVQVITVSENADGGYVSSHYLSGIQSIVDLQLPVACHWREKNVTLYLAEYQNGGPFIFAAVSNAIEYRVVIKSDEDISCTMTELARSDEILVTSVNGQVGDVSTTTKVELTKQTDGSYLSDLSAADIMAAYKDHKTVHCYHNKMILPLIRSVVNDAVFGGIYDGQIHTVTVASNRVATVTVIPLASGGGSDGITPHIGANGNWWIGEEDTGVSAGATDEQISCAVEEYMEENPLVKTVNGTEPDENGNVELKIRSGVIPAPETAEVGQTIVVKEVDENGKPTAWEAADFPSGGGGERWEELINVTVEEEVSKVETTLDNPGKFKIISVYLDLRNVTTNTALTVTVDINSPFIWTPNEAYTICQVPSFGGANQTDLKFFGTVLFTPSHVISQGYVWNRQQLVCNPNPNITADAVASTITVATQNNVNLFGVGTIIKVYGVRA